MAPMMCSIDAVHLKTWSKMLTTLTTIADDEVHFAFTDASLTLTVFNANLSVSATYTFYSSFFHRFSVPRGEAKTFKLPAKCIVKPFKSMRFVTKSCSTCELAFDDAKDYVIVIMGCKSVTEIRYTIKLLDESEDLQPEVNPEQLPNWIRTEPKLMMANLGHFSHSKGLTDLTFKAFGNGRQILMKNCATDLMRKDAKIYTELNISTQAFERHEISIDTEVTFPLKDFKTFVALSDYLKLPTTVHFNGAQDPVIILFRNEEFEATLILATKFLENDEVGPDDASSQRSSNGISNVTSDSEPPQERHRNQIGANGRSRPSRIDMSNPRTTPMGHNNAERRESPEMLVSEPPELPCLTPPPQAMDVDLEVVDQVLITATNQPSKQKKRVRATRGRSPEEEETTRPCRKKTREFISKLISEHQPYDMYKKFPGHDIVLVGPSDDENDADSDDDN